MITTSTNIAKIGTNAGTNVRLVGGSVDGVGRLEIKQNLEKWGSVCMDNWRPVNSLIVCRELCGYL